MPKGLSGPPSLFRRKVRAPVSITLTAKHHRQVNAAAERLHLTRADVIGLLIELHADHLTPEEVRQQQERNAADEPTA